MNHRNQQPLPFDDHPASLHGVERLLSAQELADYLEVPVKTIYTWRHRNTGPRGFRIGKHLRFRWCDETGAAMPEPSRRTLSPRCQQPSHQSVSSPFENPPAGSPTDRNLKPCPSSERPLGPLLPVPIDPEIAL